MGKYIMLSVVFFFFVIIQYFGQYPHTGVTAAIDTVQKTNDIVPHETRKVQHPTASPPLATGLQIEPNGEPHNVRGDGFDALRSVTVSSSSSVATDSSASSSSSSSSSPVDKAAALFEPEDDWKEILPGQAIPGGLDIRMDFASGKKYARNIPLEDRGRYRKFSSTGSGSSSSSSLSSSSSSSESASLVPTDNGNNVPSGLAAAVMEAHQEEEGVLTDDTTGNAPLESPIDPRITELHLDPASSRMATILLGLPEPELEVEQALNQSLSREEVQALLKKVWDRRQEVLKEAFAHAKTEGTQMQELLQKLIHPDTYNLTIEDMIDILESLEFFVATLHNAEDFHAIGGFDVIISLLNHSNILVRTPAAWIMGTAIKGHNGLQRAALDLGLAPALMEMLHSSLDTLEGTNKAPQPPQQQVLTLKAINKVIYAVNGLVRYSALAQSHVLSVGGGTALHRTLNIARRLATVDGGGSTGHDNDGSSSSTTSLPTPVQKQARTLIGKIFTLLSDLVQDENDYNSRLSSSPSTKEEISTHSNIVRVKLQSDMDKYRTMNETKGTTEDNNQPSPTSTVASKGGHDGPTLTRVEKDTVTGQRKVFNVITSNDNDAESHRALAGTNGELGAPPAATSTSSTKSVTLPFLNYLRNNKGTNQEFCTDMRSAVRTVQALRTEEGTADYEVKLMVETSSEVIAHEFC